MPFTLAHPAAVLPLRRVRFLRTVPLIIGAVSPDIPYYLPGRIAQYIPQQTHTLLGTFTLDVPMGMAVLLLMWLFRIPLAAPLGTRVRALCLGALQRFGSRPLNWALAPLSILVGAWTHLLWDSFTHPEGWMVHRFALLRAPVTIGWYTGELCHVLQYLSSVLGLAVLVIWFVRLPAAPAAGESRPRPGGPILFAVLLVGAAVAGGYETYRDIVQRVPALYGLLYLMLTRTTAWFGLLYALAGLIIVLRRGFTARALAS